MRTCDSCSLSNQAWKSDRSYILADQVEAGQNGSIIVSGFLKGNCINANQIVHVTGADDFHIEKIEIQAMGVRAKFSM